MYVGMYVRIYYKCHGAGTCIIRPWRPKAGSYYIHTYIHTYIHILQMPRCRDVYYTTLETDSGLLLYTYIHTYIHTYITNATVQGRVLYDLGDRQRALVLFEQVVKAHEEGDRRVGVACGTPIYLNALSMVGLAHQQVIVCVYIYI